MGEILVQEIDNVRGIIYSGKYAILMLTKSSLNLKEIGVPRGKINKNIKKIRIIIEALS